MLTYAITAADHGRRVESFLQNLLPAAPIAYLRKLTKSGHCLVNGATAMPDLILSVGDRLTLKESGRSRELLSAGRPELDILFEDDWLVIVNKEAGLPMHKTAEEGNLNLVVIAERFFRQKETMLKLRPVNRLDRGTSGGAMLAKSSTSAGMFGRFVKEVGLTKVYLTVVAGELPSEGTVTNPIDGKEAQTRFQRLWQGKGTAFAAVYPVTGRTHQIRKHLSLSGHPILGDRRYGGPSLAGYPGHALHAWGLAFRHPAREETVALFAPLPAGFLALLEEVTGPGILLPLLRELPALLVIDDGVAKAPAARLASREE